MYSQMKSILFNILIIGLALLFIWNLYTITFHGYVTNGVWETYYEEEPIVFMMDFFELFIPILIIAPFYLFDIVQSRYFKAHNDGPKNPAMKAKRLRRKKRKNKRK